MTNETKLRILASCLFVVLYLGHWRVQKANQRITFLEARLSIVETNATQTLAISKRVNVERYSIDYSTNRVTMKP
jgi:hypothetical protein